MYYVNGLSINCVDLVVADVYVKNVCVCVIDCASRLLAVGDPVELVVGVGALSAPMRMSLSCY